MIELEAYAADCRLVGAVDLGDGRLTDLLNAAPELCLRDARLESLADGHIVEAPEMTVARDELYAVVASGPRGDVARRLRTHATRVVVDLGPYRVVGLVHGTPASDPIASALRRAAWVPLTEAVITFHRGSDVITGEIQTLLVNRTLASSFRAVEEESTPLPWETRRTPRPAASRAVDLTSTLRDEVPSGVDEADRPRVSRSAR